MIMFRSSILALCGAAAWSLWADDAPPKARLAEVENIQPTSYNAVLTLDPQKTTFEGAIEIHMDIKAPVRTIWLNQEKLRIDRAGITAQGQRQSAQIVPGGDDFVGLRFTAPIAPGPAVVAVNYAGEVISKDTSGVFRQQDGGTWYIYSQFESTDARAAFPCFDEPSYKTPWQLTMHIPATDAAISNTQPMSETLNGSVKTVVFRQTRPLPSYLVAFGVGPFDFVPAGTAGKNKVPVRIVVPRGHAAEAGYAAEVTATILTRLEDYFGIPYPYDKADQVAIPNTAGFGAMENVGMVTYAQQIILADPKTDRLQRQRNYASTAAHELAHQWFGDMVTMAWWDDIWLNEAFATWMERKLIADWKPEWETRVGDVGATLGAENEDSLISARKIRQPILTKDDISNAFDGITYEKGAAVIGMFENWMGPAEFQRGVQAYLKQYMYRATTAADFLDAMSSSAKRDVSKPFSTFLNQSGVPLVSVKLDCARPKPALQVEQKRFLPLGSRGSANQTWGLPLCFRYGTGTTGQSKCVLVNEAARTISLDEAKGCPAWVQANDNAMGYYHVDYQDGLLARLVAGDAQARLTAPERVELMGDAEALSGAGQLPIAGSLALVEKFHADPERFVVQRALNVALAPRAQLVPDALIPNYQRFLLRNFGAKAKELGWAPAPNDTDDTRLLRSQIVQPVATWGGDQTLADQAKALTEKWFVDHSAIDSNMTASVLRTAAFYGDRALFARLLVEFKSAKDRQIRQTLLGAMSSFRDPAAIEAAMNALLDGDVPFLEGATLLFGGQDQAATRRIAFDFVKAHWDEITEKLPTGGGFDYRALLPDVGREYCDEASRNELRAWFAPRVDKFIGAPRILDQTIEAIDLCIADKAAQEPSVVTFLAGY